MLHLPKGNALRWLWSHAGRYRYGALALCLLQVLMALAGVAAPLAFRAVVDAATGLRRSDFLWALAVYGLLLLTQTGLGTLGYALQGRTTYRMEGYLRGKLFARLLRADQRELQKHSLGELNNHINEDVAIVVSSLLEMLPQLLYLAVQVVGAAVVLFWWDRTFLLLFVVLLAVAGLVLTRVYRPLQALYRESRQKYDRVMTVQQDTLRNTLLIRSFSAFDTVEQAWRRRTEGWRVVRDRQNAYANTIYSGYTLLNDLGFLACLLWYGMGILAGTVSYGTLAGALQLVGQLQSPMGSFGRIFSHYCALCTSAQRLQELYAIRQDPLSEQPATLPDVESITLDHVSFAYEGTPVLEDICLTVHRGDVIAIAGLSGAGKSTLFRLLLAFYPPDSGELRVTLADGSTQPLNAALRTLFAYVPQGNDMLAGSICQAVAFRYHSKTFTPEERARIRWACQVACVDTFVEALPEQYDARIGEDGAGFSEGQLQRLSIARALYCGAPVLLLDEATSALDVEVEQKLLEHLRALRDKTVLLITHDAQARQICSRTIYVENGKLREASDEPDA